MSWLLFFLQGAGLSDCGRACARSGAGGAHWLLAAAAFKLAGEKHRVPFEVVYQTDPRRSTTVTLWLCFSEYEGFTNMLPEEY